MSLKKQYQKIGLLKELEEMMITKQSLDADIYDLVVKIINESFKAES